MVKSGVKFLLVLFVIGSRTTGAEESTSSFRTVLVVQREMLYEFTLSGNEIRSVEIPRPEGLGIGALDLVMDRRGLVHVVREGDSETSSFICTYDPLTATWMLTDLGIWYGGGGTCNGLTIWEDTLWTKGLRIELPELTFTAIDTGIQYGTCLLCVGLDGLLYETSSASPDSEFRVLDPADLSVLREPRFQDQGRFIRFDVRDITATAEGEVLIADWDGLLTLFDAEGNLLRQLQTPVHNLMDLNLAKDGMIICGSRGGEVVVSDISLSSATVFTVNPSSSWPCFVGMADIPFPVEEDDDCNRNGIGDLLEIAEGIAEDCNDNLLPDDCELGPMWTFPLPYRQNWPFSYRVHAMADLDRDGDEDVLVGSEDSLFVGFNREGARFEFSDETIDFEHTVLSVRTGDFDADHNLDIAVTVLYSDDLQVFYGEGDGRFTDRTVIYVGDDISSIAVADFNGDWAGDVAIAPRDSDDLLVFLSQGRTFVSRSSPALPWRPGELAVADLDHDGHQDLVSVGRSGLMVLAGSGDGQFTARQTIEPTYSLEKPRVLRLNGDQYPDVMALSSFEMKILAYLAGSDGRLVRDPSRDVRLRAPGSGESVQTFLLLDTNLDRHEDIVVYRGDWIYVHEKEGYGGFGPDRAFRCRFEDVMPGDVNNDGIVDLVNPWRGDALLGQGDGSFRSLLRIPLGMSSHGLSAVDVNDDSIPDLVLVSESNDRVLVLLGEGDGRYADPLAFSVQPGPSLSAGPVTLAVEDFNGDGILDVAALCERAESVALLTGEGNGQFGSPVFFAAGIRPLAMKSGDLDRDGAIDLVVVDEGTIIPLFGNGAGRFSQTMLHCEDCSLRSAALGDLNEDGLGDIVVTDLRSGLVRIHEGTGGRRFQLSPATFEGRAPLVVRDLDGDGHEDLIFWTETGELAVPWGRGDGTFDVPTLFEAGRSLDPTSNGVVFEVSDFDGDGVMDVVTAYAGLTLLRNLGGRTLAPPVDLMIDPDCVGLLAADLDEDGDQDIVTTGFPGTCCSRDHIGVLWNESRLSNDCNGNGVPDDCDVRVGQLDRDRNRIPDTCQQGGLQLPGDCSQDFTVDISDATCLLGALFLGEPALLPCGSGTFTESSNVMLLDFQPDGFVDVSDGICLLNFLFLGHAPHWLLASDAGMAACVPIVGCPDREECH